MRTNLVVVELETVVVEKNLQDVLLLKEVELEEEKNLEIKCLLVIFHGLSNGKT